tara:strand:+ start:223 stop:906 length:684 start_codon:yes stop_codon:yes gene_type:complete
MSDMKLIMEGWKNYSEQELREQILEYIEANNLMLTEEQINEAMPKWLKKMGAGAALASILMGVPTAQAADTTAMSSQPTTTQQVEIGGDAYDIELVKIFKQINQASQDMDKATSEYKYLYNRMHDDKGEEAGYWQPEMLNFMPSPAEYTGVDSNIAREAANDLKNSQYGDMDRTKLIVKLLNTHADTVDAYTETTEGARSNTKFLEFVDQAQEDPASAEEIIMKFGT